ncbi:hypothetical protein SeLEV6574_g03070 [Synchytrium endobioticum]|uniref:RING-type E3 ubiquitin transferase n=1 Tax=Synchytrium endobioticum TaxID=286115 RepID=A0A507D5E9_9FUNG|nr:hypothetical protein SeLEV6574_g03070 [Synchytrium endobioticum]
MMTTEAMRANTNDGGDGIDPECRCPVCYEWLEAPVTFECNHSICLGCLQQMLDSAYCKGVCPMCRHRVLNFIRRNAKNPAAMVNQPLAARIAQKQAEGARSTILFGVEVTATIYTTGVHTSHARGYLACDISRSPVRIPGAT